MAMRIFYAFMMASVVVGAAGCSTTVPLNTAPPSAKAKTEAKVEQAVTRTRISLYVCPTYGDIVVRYSFGEVTLVLKDDTYVLPQAPAASGSKFGDQGNLFWEKSPEAQVGLGGKPVETCRNDPERAPWVDAWLRGVSFRAQGADPAWWVEILDGDHITLGLEDGAHLVRAPAEPPALEKGSRVYHADSDEGKLTVSIAPATCTLASDPTRFPDAVTVKLHDDIYKGCGEPAER